MNMAIAEGLISIVIIAVFIAVLVYWGKTKSTMPQLDELTDEEYRVGLARIQELMDTPISLQDPEYLELTQLADQLEAYEKKHFKI